jgi:hypothetical protein
VTNTEGATPYMCMGGLLGHHSEPEQLACRPRRVEARCVEYVRNFCHPCQRQGKDHSTLFRWPPPRHSIIAAHAPSARASSPVATPLATAQAGCDAANVIIKRYPVNSSLRTIHAVPLACPPHEAATIAVLS